MALKVRRTTFVGIGRVALAVASLALWLPAQATRPLSAYTIYGEHGAFIGVGSTINGLVGARDGEWLNGIHDTNPPTTAIKLNGAASIVGDARSGADVNLQNNAHITGTLYRVGSLTLGSGSTVGVDNHVADADLPVFPGSVTSFTCPSVGPNITAGGALGSGAYGDVTLAGGQTLELLDANNPYVFNSITAANGTTIKVDVPGVIVQVCGNAYFNADLEIIAPTPAATDISFEVHGTDPHNAFFAGGGSDIVGPIFAPYGGIHIGSGGSPSSFEGSLLGFAVDIEHGVVGSGGGCCVPTPPQTSGKDSTIIHGDQNTNEGASPQIWLRTQTADIVGFDISDVDTSAVTSATLVLTVCYTPGIPDFCPTAPNGWGPSGGLINAYRLFAGYSDWAEGDGNTFPVNKTRGTGPGVTWNCKTDLLIQNNARDCVAPSFWDNGGQSVQFPATSLPQLITNGMADGTIVTFDVTADVQAGLLGDPAFISWFIRWAQQNGGFVSFYSKEGAIRAGSPLLAPTLVIVP